MAACLDLDVAERLQHQRLDGKQPIHYYQQGTTRPERRIRLGNQLLEHVFPVMSGRVGDDKIKPQTLGQVACAVSQHDMGVCDPITLNISLAQT